ncbi:MAG: hypothetical protein K2X94_03630 [Amoebophilaceae bacterium]|nr:hypothetical protein [Amoebophilaceae bacterium]
MHIDSPAAPSSIAATTTPPPDTAQIRQDITKDNQRMRKRAQGQAANTLFNETKLSTGTATSLLGSNGSKL